MKKILFILASMSVFFTLNAQSITGRIIDREDNPIEYATVVLQTPDSEYVDVTFTDSLGYFKFRRDLQNFRLIVQHLMYMSSEEAYSTPNVGVVYLDSNEQSLSEAVVRGERPLVKVIDGRMTYNMPQLLQEKVVSNAYESLLHLPGVSEQGGGLTLAGASSLTVIVNGKPTTMSSDQLMELLKNTPKERVLSAEVMYSAPPQYHVRGAAINLVLAGRTTESPTLQGQVNAAYNQYRYDSYNTGVTLLFGSKKFSTDFMYTFGYGTGWRNDDIISNHLYNETIYSITQNDWHKTTKPSHNVRIGNDYYFNQDSKISIAYTGQLVPWSHSDARSKGTYSESYNQRKYDRPLQMHNAALNYASGFGLSVGGDYTYYSNHSTQHYKENMVGKEDAFNTTSKQDINRVSAYADQNHALGGSWGLSYGAKFAYASDESSQQYLSLVGNDMAGLDSKSKGNEYTYDLYAGFEKDFSERLSTSFSLTGEYYEFNKYNEWSIFPAMEVTYVSAPSHIFQLSLSSDKTYPDYWEMMNSVSYLNGYTEVHGNPDLRPYKDYSVQLNYILKSKYVFTLYGIYLDDYAVQLPYQSPDKLALIYKTTNFDYSRKFGISASIPFKLGNFLSSRLTLHGFYHNEKSNHFHDMSFDKHNLVLYSSLNNTFTISTKPSVVAELNGSYITKNIQGPSEIPELYQVDAGVKWTFMNDNAELRFKVNDIFNSWAPDKWNMQLDKQDIKMYIAPDSRYVSLSFTYKFGNFKEKKHKEVDLSRFKQ